MTITAGTVMALAYSGGVAVATDRTAFSGRTPRFQNSTRQYRLNDFCLVSFSGDFADFQWLQNLLERHQIELQIDAGMDYMKPKMVHAFLASLFYQRRSKMNPILNTVVVSGMQQVDFHAGKTRPFIGIVDIRGSAFEVDHMATDLGTFLLNQMLDTRQNQAKGEQFDKKEALAVLASAMQILVHRNAQSGNTFDLSTVDAVEGVKFHEQITVTGTWDVAELCDGTYR